MTSQQNSDRRIGEDRGDEANVAHEAEALFTRLGDWGLGRLMELARDEMKKRLTDAEKRIAEMKQHFRLPEASPAQASFPHKQIKKSIKMKPEKLMKAGKPSAGARGQLRSTILQLLSEGPKTRAELEAELTNRGIPATSTGTTINRLKKDGILAHDKATKAYSLSASNSGPVDSD